MNHLSSPNSFPGPQQGNHQGQENSHSKIEREPMKDYNRDPGDEGLYKSRESSSSNSYSSRSSYKTPSGQAPSSIPQVKWLAQALVFSGALNIALLATFVYFMLKASPSQPANFELQPSFSKRTGAVLKGNEEIYQELQALTFGELIAKLQDETLVEDGFTQRDLALGCLVGKHYFNLSQALPSQVLQKRLLVFGDPKNQDTPSLIIFTGLGDAEYQNVLHYAKEERWPLTSRGLFEHLKREEDLRDPSLLQAFCLTPEFNAFEVLFSRSEKSVDKKAIIDLIRQGDWNILSEFTAKQKVAQDLSPAMRRELLLSYLQLKSKKAAEILLEQDYQYAVKNLDDATSMLVLDLLDERSETNEKFAQALLASPRGDNVWQKAAEKLYAFSGEPFPQKYDHLATLARFVPDSLRHSKLQMTQDVGLDLVELSPPKMEHSPLEISMPHKKETNEKALSKAPLKAAAVKAPQERAKVPVVKKDMSPSKTSTAHAQSSKPTYAKTRPKLDSKADKASSKLSRKKDKSVVVHVVQTGDTLPRLAKQYGTDVATIKKINGLKSDKLRPGMSLKVPMR